MATSHLVVTFCATAGKNGEDLGVDEEQVVLFVYLLFDVLNCKVRGKLLSNFFPRNPHFVNTHTLTTIRFPIQSPVWRSSTRFCVHLLCKEKVGTS